MPNEVDVKDIPKPVLTKKDFVRRYQRGEFGNRAPTWGTLQHWEFDRPHRIRSVLYHVRNMRAGGPTWYNLPFNQVSSVALQAQNQGERIYISGMAPHDRGTFQGEIQQSIGHLDLTYTSARLPMRDAFREYGTNTYSGLLAIQRLRNWMDAASYDWVCELLARYPDHVIEFSCFEIPWGTIPNRNTVIWEVRKY